MNTIGERIKYIRKSNNMTQGEFIKNIGISRSHISNIEKGKENPSNAVIKLICNEFKVNEEWVTNNIGEMYSFNDEIGGIENMDKFESMNPTLYKAFIGNEKIIPEDLAFYKNNTPELVELRDNIYDQIQNIANAIDSKKVDSSLKDILNNLSNLIDDVISLNEEKSFIMGYKTGVKMIIESIK